MNKPSEAAAVLDVIDPDASAAAAINGAWVSAKNFHSFMAIALAGQLGTAATLDMKIQQATDGSGTGVKDVSGAAITQLVKASNDDNQAIINLHSDQLDAANGFDYIRVVLTVGTATSDAAALLLGFDPRYAPASDNDAASVVEIVG